MEQDLQWRILESVSGVKGFPPLTTELLAQMLNLNHDGEFFMKVFILIRAQCSGLS
jgi:hypothetical protein